MSGDRNNGIIAREGLPFVLGPFVLAVLAGAVALGLGIPLMCWAALLLFIITFAVIWFFRNPARFPPDGEDLVISPADGRVLHVQNVDDQQWGSGRCIKISIFMSVMNVHVNRSPVNGRVVRKRYVPGKFLVASLDKASDDNERAGLTIMDRQGRVLTVVQVAGLVARRIVCYPEEGTRLTRGSRYGLIRFGSRLELYLPPQTEVHVAQGDVTRAGETVIGTLPPAEEVNA